MTREEVEEVIDALIRVAQLTEAMRVLRHEDGYLDDAYDLLFKERDDLKRKIKWTFDHWKNPLPPLGDF